MPQSTQEGSVDYLISSHALLTRLSEKTAAFEAQSPSEAVVTKTAAALAASGAINPDEQQAAAEKIAASHHETTVLLNRMVDLYTEKAAMLSEIQNGTAGLEPGVASEKQASEKRASSRRSNPHQRSAEADTAWLQSLNINPSV